MALVSAATLREYLPEIQGSDLDSDLNGLISRVEAAVARYLGFSLADGATALTLDQSTYTLHLDGPMYALPTVLQLPIKAGSQYDSDLINSRVILKTDSTASFDRGYRNIKAVIVAGFATGSPPPDLVHAICVWASHLQRAKSNQGSENVTQRNSTIRLSPRTMPDEVRELLRDFRNVSTIL
jgi:hypothetical protein